MLLHSIELEFSSFRLLSLLLEFLGYFQRSTSLPTKRQLSLTESSVCIGICVRDTADAMYRVGFYFCSCSAYSLVK